MRVFQCPEERYYSSGQLGESLDLMNIVERERRGVTLPSQGRVHRSPEPPGALLFEYYKVL